MVVWGIPDRGNVRSIFLLLPPRSALNLLRLKLLASAEFQALVLGLVGKSAEQNVPERPTSPL